jgi:hypothetical protein
LTDLCACAVCACCSHRSEYARSEAGDASAVGSSGPADEPGPEFHLLPDLPPSWVPKLAVARDMMDMRCPRVSTAHFVRIGSVEGTPYVCTPLVAVVACQLNIALI